MNKRYCRILLKQALLDLTGRERQHFKARAGVTGTGRPGKRYYLVEWPRMSKTGGYFVWEGQADNPDHAKALALNAWLEHHAPQARARHLKDGFPEGALQDEYRGMPWCARCNAYHHPTAEHSGGLAEPLDPRRGDEPIADNE